MLAANQAQIWLARPEALAGEAAILAPDELERLARFRFEADRQLALASRALVRRTLSRCADVAPRDWRFVTGEHGRPEIAAPGLPARLRFNAANTRGLVVCAVTWEREIGVDAEKLRDPAPLDVARTHFAPAERAALAALPPAETAHRFYALWTLKEAYIKARGVGLSLGLDRFSFSFDGDDAPPRLGTDPVLGDDAASWQIALLAPTAEHLLALCVRRGHGPDLEVTTAWDEGG